MSDSSSTLVVIAIVAGCFLGIAVLASLWSWIQQLCRSQTSRKEGSQIIESSIEKAIRIVNSVRDDLEGSLPCSVFPVCGRQVELRRQVNALLEVERLLGNPLPLHLPDVLQAVHSGDVSADKDTEAWLSYELANRSSMIDTWTTNREEFLAREGMGKRPSRSHSIISMRDSTPLSPHLQIIDSWDFDVFNLVDQGKEQMPLAAVGFCLFLKHDLFKKLELDMDKVESLMANIDDSYTNTNPYHCNLHGAEVAHTVSYMLTHGGFYSKLKPSDVAAMIVAALCHDIAHPGQTNQFHIATQSELALCYNNISVLENYHAAFTRKLMRRPESNLFSHLDQALRREIDELLISVILATDMSTNLECCAKFRRTQMANTTPKRNSLRSIPVEPTMDAQSMCSHKESFFIMMQMCMKCADVSHCVKNWNIHKRFTDRITQEFFRQGDLEREAGIPISPFMDRRAANNVAKNQAGFFQFLVQPAWSAWLSVCGIPGAEENLHNNIKRWEQLASQWTPDQPQPGVVSTESTASTATTASQPAAPFSKAAVAIDIDPPNPKAELETAPILPSAT
ncbi:Phosphodiesterase [Plasmodiophora brassicae]